jgi:hypothetical protein
MKKLVAAFLGAAMPMLPMFDTCAFTTNTYQENAPVYMLPESENEVITIYFIPKKCFYSPDECDTCTIFPYRRIPRFFLPKYLHREYKVVKAWDGTLHWQSGSSDYLVGTDLTINITNCPCYIIAVDSNIGSYFLSNDSAGDSFYAIPKTLKQDGIEVRQILSGSVVFRGIIEVGFSTQKIPVFRELDSSDHLTRNVFRIFGISRGKKVRSVHGLRMVPNESPKDRDSGNLPVEQLDQG